MDQRNFGRQGLNFNPNEMYSNNENRNNFAARKLLYNTNSPIPSSTTSGASFHQLMHKPPYSAHHVVPSESIQHTQPVQRQHHHSPFFMNTNNPNEGSSFPQFNRANNFPQTGSTVYNANNNLYRNSNDNSNIVYTPKPFINQNTNSYGSTNAYQSYTLSKPTIAREPEIQVIDLEQSNKIYDTNIRNGPSTKCMPTTAVRFNQISNFESSANNIHTAINSTQDNMIIESTEKLQIENNANFSMSSITRSNLKRKYAESTAKIMELTDELDEPEAKRIRSQTMRVLTGNIEKIIQWHKILPQHTFSMYETIGSCINIRNGSNSIEKRLLLRDDRGPVLQISYYETEVPLDANITVGKLVHCIGRMVSVNRLIAHKISMVYEEKSINIQSHLQRIAFKLENTVNRVTYQQ